MNKYLRFFIFIILFLPVVSHAQSKPDTCEVYLVDVELTQRVWDSLPPQASDQQIETKLAAGIKIVGRFTREAGEEVLTNKSFPIPHSKLVVTAAAMYTDESMASKSGQDSMLLGIVVSNKAQENALVAPDNAVAEVTYDEHTDKVRAKKYIEINHRLFLVGLECQFNNREESK